MATKKKEIRPAKMKSTDWRIGQPLAFPPAIKRAEQKAVNAAMRGPFAGRRDKRKKK